MKIIPLCLLIICTVLISPDLIYSEGAGGDANSSISTNGNLTSRSVPLLTTTTTPPDPTQISCDVNKPGICPSGLYCNSKGNGKCGCPGSTIYSLVYRRCKIRAGGNGCRISGDCTDHARCWHPRNCRRCFPEPTECHCSCGHLYGINGVCPAPDPNARCAGSSLKSADFHTAIVLTASLSLIRLLLSFKWPVSL